MGRIIQFLKDVKVELTKVVWPTRREAVKATLVVILFSLFVAVFLGIVDFGLNRFLGLLVK
jgi:preprotein translocase subunit SecE